ncbi:hypothetical protein ABFS82_07G055300 [Erythranthe guttata]
MITLSKISPLRNHRRPPKKAPTFHTLGNTADSSISLLNLLDLSIENRSEELTLQSHARAQRVGLTQHPLVAQKLIFAFCRFKRPFDARLVFEPLLVKNAHICNTLLSGYGKNQLFLESLELFREMCGGCVLPDDFTYSVMFKIVGDLGEVFHGEMVQGMGLKNGVVSDTVVGNSLMSMYGRFGCFDDSLKVFDEMPLRGVASWNALISGYLKANVDGGNDSLLFGYRLWDYVKAMQNDGFKLDAYTVSSLLSLCGGDGAEVDDCRENYCRGREFHSYIIRNGLDSSDVLDSDVHLGCRLIDIYSKNGQVHVGKRVFDRLKLKNVFTWTAVINGYVRCGEFDEASVLFREMQLRDGVGPNKVTLVAILPACSSAIGLIGVKQIHGFATRRELNQELSLSNALIDTYSKCGSLKYATQVFEHECIYKDAISWGTIICGYGLHGHGQRAVNLFDEMLQRGVKPDQAIVVGVLSACCISGLLNDATRIYDSLTTIHQIKPTVEICACMVDMYGRLGKLNRALEFIKSIPVEPGPSIWGALSSASALHGNIEMQELAYKSLIKIEPHNCSNYIALSNLHAASNRWDNVAEVRKDMRERGLKKLPGCSWISVNSGTHSFFVADKTHPCSELIYATVLRLVSTMKLTFCAPDFVYSSD